MNGAIFPPDHNLFYTPNKHLIIIHTKQTSDYYTHQTNIWLLYLLFGREKSVIFLKFQQKKIIIDNCSQIN